MLKEQKGITLVALIITIIVMLILAGVSISLVVGEDGVLGQAQTAGTETKKGAIREAISLGSADFYAACYDTTNGTPTGGQSNYNKISNLITCIDNNYEGGAKTVTLTETDGTTAIDDSTTLSATALAGKLTIDGETVDVEITKKTATSVITIKAN